MKFGVSPFGDLAQRRPPTRSARTPPAAQSYDDHLRRHPQVGAARSWIDYIVPQLYWNIGFAAADYAKLVPWWADVVARHPTCSSTSGRPTTRAATRRYGRSG